MKGTSTSLCGILNNPRGGFVGQGLGLAAVGRCNILERQRPPLPYVIIRHFTHKRTNALAADWLPLTRELSSASETEGEKNQNFCQTSSLPPAFCSRKNPPPSSEGGKKDTPFVASKSPGVRCRARPWSCRRWSVRYFGTHHLIRHGFAAPPSPQGEGLPNLPLQPANNAQTPARTRATPARFRKNGKPPRGFVRAGMRVRLDAGMRVRLGAGVARRGCGAWACQPTTKTQPLTTVRGCSFMRFCYAPNAGLSPAKYLRKASTSFILTVPSPLQSAAVLSNLFTAMPARNFRTVSTSYIFTAPSPFASPQSAVVPVAVVSVPVTVSEEVAVGCGSVGAT